MPFEYRIDTCLTVKELEEAINQWAKKGFEPHNISSVYRETVLCETQRPALLLIVRKIVRKPRKAKV